MNKSKLEWLRPWWVKKNNFLHFVEPHKKGKAYYEATVAGYFETL